jgi:hypothetical protein
VIEILKIALIVLWIPIGLGVVVLCGGLDDTESDGMGVLLAVPLWPLVLVIGGLVWVWQKVRP